MVGKGRAILPPRGHLAMCRDGGRDGRGGGKGIWGGCVGILLASKELGQECW